MEIETRPINRIIPYSRNPRKNDHAVDAVAMSLEQYGWQQPIVVDREGVIIVGHTRWKAAKQLGMTECPVVVAELSEEKAKAYRIADNRTGELAEWDQKLLDIELGELVDSGYDVSLAGFEFDPEPVDGSGQGEDTGEPPPSKEIECPGCGLRWEK